MSVAAMSYVASICSTEADLIDSFMTSVCGSTGPSSRVELRGMAELCLEPVPAHRINEEASMSRLRDADICVMLVRHLDVGSLDRLRDLVRRLPSAAIQSLHVTICRKPAESEYKISCTKCSQNLIVRDALAFLRVKCPHCHDVFTVPAQTDIIRDLLLLNASRLVRKVTMGESESCREVLAHMIGQVKQRQETVKHSTMRIDLPHEFAPA